MKNNNLKKIITLVLALALLVGSVSGISVSAEGSDGTRILAQNIIYGDKIAIAYAVDASLEDAIQGNVGVSYFWSDSTAENAKKATLLDTTVDSNLYLGKYPVFVTEGVPAKELDKIAYAAVTYGDETPDEFTHSYSAVNYLYARLYKDGFVNKTEGDGLDFERRNLYLNLLAYGASAQSVLVNGKAENASDRVTLITDYSYAYTTSDDVIVNGGKADISAGSFTVTAEYKGDSVHVGWILTDLDGNKIVVEGSTFTVSGVVLIAPKFGVHTCTDTDNDHVCNVCGEIATECKNDNNDHNCDICGARIELCKDENGDAVCDVCKMYGFDYTVNSGVSLYTFTSTGNANPAHQTSISENSSSKGYYGTLGSIATDPKNAANKALKIVINGGTNNSSTSGAATYPSRIVIEASEKAEGGKIHVLEYDFYVERLNKENSRNFLTLYAYDSEGRAARLQNGGKDGSTNAHSKGILRVNGTEVVKNAFQMGVGTNQNESSNYANFDSHTWYRFRFVFDEANGTITTYVSFDEGVHWYLAAKEATTTSLKTENADFAGVDHLAFGFDTYGHGEIFYIDNVSYKVMTEAPAAHSQSGIDSIEALYR